MTKVVTQSRNVILLHILSHIISQPVHTLLHLLHLHLSALLLPKGLQQRKRNLFDVVIKTNLLPMRKKFQRLDLLKNRLNKHYLVSLKSSLVVTTLGLSRQRCHTHLGRSEKLIFLELFDSNSLLRIDPKDSAKDLRQDLKSVLRNRRIVLQLHLLNVKTLSTLRTYLVLHVHTLKRKIAEQHTEQHHTHRPHVHLVVVYLLPENLRSHVRCSTTKSIHVLVVLTTKTQIANLNSVSVRLSF